MKVFNDYIDPSDALEALLLGQTREPSTAIEVTHCGSSRIV